MIDFLKALADPELLFLRYAVIVGLLSSVALGVVGSYVVTRRVTYIAAAISHCVLGGIGIAVYLEKRWGQSWCDPMYGAVAAALLAAVLIGMVSIYARQREDTVISAVWAVGMAIGLLFLNLTPGYTDPIYLIYGSIWLISSHDVWLVMIMDVLVVLLGVGFYPKLLAVCFDEEFAQLRGVHAKIYYMLLLALTALTVVLLVRIVGVLLVIALLTLPAAAAGHFTRRLGQMMVAAVLFCMAFIGTGIVVSYEFERLPSGPVIIFIAGGTYFLILLGGRLFRWRKA
jgi:zinc transport system permease protein